MFGHGKAVYETGGYLRRGEVVWLLAKIDRPIHVGGQDEVAPYAVMVNSHDGSSAYQIRLTTVRVVCKNTLNASLRESKFGKQFRRSHSGSIAAHAVAADEFYRQSLTEIDNVEQAFNLLLSRACNDATFAKFLSTVLPEPKQPPASAPESQHKAYQTRLKSISDARSKVTLLREAGMGTEIAGVRGTLWGALNAFVEYSDFYAASDGPMPANALLGDAAALKARAFQFAMTLA